jgi:CCR4-NOT transcription complex subunit 9
VQKILLDDVGLNYICATAERFFAVGAVLATMVQLLAEQPSVRLLKHIIRCYLRLSDNPRLAQFLHVPHFASILFLVILADLSG